MSRPTRTLVAGAAAATLAVLAACGPADDPAAVPGPTDVPTATATPDPATTADASPGSGVATDPDADGTAPAFPTGTAPGTAEPSADAALTVTDVRVGHHDGFDRVVLELGGTGTPGWHVEYVDAPVADPGDQPLALAGDQALQVVVTGTTYPFETGLTEFTLGQPVPLAGGTSVAEAVLVGTFEGRTQAYVGVVGDPAPFRAYLLADPVRLVVDVRG